MQDLIKHSESENLQKTWFTNLLNHHNDLLISIINNLLIRNDENERSKKERITEREKRKIERGEKAF